MTVHHALKLFQNTDGTESQALHFTEKKKSVTAESYDEIVFHEPTRLMKTLLEDLPPLTNGVYKHETDCTQIIYFLLIRSFKSILKIFYLVFYLQLSIFPLQLRPIFKKARRKLMSHARKSRLKSRNCEKSWN